MALLTKATEPSETTRGSDSKCVSNQLQLSMFKWGHSKIGNKMIKPGQKQSTKSPCIKHSLQRKRSLVVADGFN